MWGRICESETDPLRFIDAKSAGKENRGTFDMMNLEEVGQ